MKYQCPMCDATSLIIVEQTSYYLDTLELFCHSVKAQDPDAEVKCLACWHKGVRKDFEVQE